MTETILNDAAAREQALDCTRSFIVQAPAGSGKTALLTQRFLRLLARVRQPESVLAITFTKKAAAEMRARIIDALVKASDHCRPVDRFEASVYDDASAALAHSERCGWRLLEQPMRLQIMTVDALNSRLVQAMPVTSRSGGVNIVESEAGQRLLQDAADALLDWVTETSGPGPAVRRFLQHVDIHTGIWRHQIMQRLAVRDQWLALALDAAQRDPAELRRESESALRALVSRRVAALEKIFPKALKPELHALAFAADSRLGGQFGVPEHWQESNNLDTWRSLARLSLTKVGAIRRSVDKTIGFAPELKTEKTAFAGVLTSLSEIEGLAERWAAVRDCPSPEYDDDQWQLIVAMLTVLPAAAGELQRLMNRRGVMDYPALAAAALQGLGGRDVDGYSHLALRLDYQIRHILVDEMQDTSARQYELLDKLTSGWQPGEDRSLFCVGDPMQSIYRFRGAEVSRFLNAWEYGIGDVPLEQLVLTTNFRSDAVLVDWFNRTFRALLGGASDPLLDQVAFSASAARPDASSSGEVLWYLDDKTDFDTLMASHISELKRRFPDDSIAVLCRSRGHLDALAEHLSRAGIAYTAIEMQRLTERPEVTDLIALTRALEHPGDRLAWFGLLRAPFVGLSFDEIDRVAGFLDAEGGSTESALQHLAAGNVLSELSAALVGDLLRVLDEDRTRVAVASLRDRVERCFCRLGGIAALKDQSALDAVNQYLDVLETLEVDGQLLQPDALERALDDNRVSARPPKADVTLMTIFKSKGLEFDHVLLPALEKGARTDVAPTLIFELPVKGAQHRGVLFSMANERQSKHDEKHPLYALLSARDQERRRNELDRVLYVAATRAKKSLRLYGRIKRKQDGTMSLPKAGSMLRQLWPVASQQVADTAQPDEVSDQNADDAVEIYVPHQRQTANRWQAPEWAWRASLRQMPSATEDSDTVSFRWAGDVARHIGTVVHEWFDRLARDPTAALKLPDEDDMLQRSQRLLRLEGVTDAQIDAAAARVNDAVRAALESDAGRNILGNRHPDSASELSLAENVDGSVQRVVIDRLIRDDKGDLWVIDYKTSVHEGGNLEAFLDNEMRRYAAQLQRYATLVERWYVAQGRKPEKPRRALFFPLYGVLKEYPDGS